MSVINPTHLIHQAKTMAATTVAGAPRQADLRRAISAAYYAVFHAVMTSAGDQFIGVTKKGSPEYGLVYRSTGHKAFKEVCVGLKRQTPPQKYAPYVPIGGFGNDFILFAAAVGDLQEKRHTADYDPLVKIRLADAELAIRTAESAIARYEVLQPAIRATFLALLIFKSRTD